MTKTLKCDKPVDLDEARKAKGLPRRKRDDPKATAYELRIRVPAEFQGVMVLASGENSHLKSN